MKPAPPDPAELVHRMRQQLILVQVRIMELEDARDETGSRLVECQQLLRAAQAVADQKLDEAAHLERVRAGLQSQYDDLRHAQHVTNEALNAARADLATSRQAAGELQAQLDRVTAARDSLQARHDDLARQLEACTALAAERQRRIAELDAEVRRMKLSRSWRWTAWIRSLERLFGGGKS